MKKLYILFKEIMKKIYFVRHGDYEGAHDGPLTFPARGTIAKLAWKIKSDMLGKEEKVLIFSSQTARTRMTAKIIANEFKDIPVEPSDVLASSPNVDLDGISALIKEHEEQCDILILVTHAEVANDFPFYYADKVWGEMARTPILNMGEALLIDCVEKTIEHFVSKR